MPGCCRMLITAGHELRLTYGTPQDGAEANLLRCLAPRAQATGSTEILAEADALLKVISVPRRLGVAARLGRVPVPRSCLVGPTPPRPGQADPRAAHRRRTAQPLDSPSGGGWCCRGCSDGRAGRADRTTCPRRSHHPRIPPRHAGRGAQCAGPAHVAATVTVGMATRDPTPRRRTTGDRARASERAALRWSTDVRDILEPHRSAEPVSRAASRPGAAGSVRCCAGRAAQLRGASPFACRSLVVLRDRLG